MKNKKIKSIVYLGLIIIGILGIAGETLAALCPSGAICIENPLSAASFDELINSIINFIFVVSIALAPLMVVIGAFYIVTGGDSEKVKTGKNIILYTFIALIIILLAKALIYVIKSVLVT